MLITCPNCGFSAQVDPGKLSPSAAVATCPQCKCRFRFRAFNETDAPDLPPTPEAVGASASQSNQSPPNIPQGIPKDSPKDIWDELDAEHQENERAGGYGPNSAQRDSLGADSLGVGDFHRIPWEHPKIYGYARGFFETCKRIVLSPVRFFGEMEATAALWPKLAFGGFWKLFDLILTLVYSPDLLQWIMTQAHVPVMEGNERTLFLALSGVLYALFLLGIFLFVALIVRVCANIVLPNKVRFATCLAVTCYPNAILVLAVIPFDFFALPLFVLMGIFNGIAIYKGLHLKPLDFLKIMVLILLSALALGGVFGMLIKMILPPL